jgi:hypothetical protein
MNRTAMHTLRRWLAVTGVAAFLAGCADEEPIAPDAQPALAAQFATQPGSNTERLIAMLRRVTNRYHNLNAAIADGFVLLHPCEDRPGEGPVGTVYVHMGRLLDGKIDPETPDALIYEPGRKEGLTLVGVEFAIPYGLWTAQTPPAFLGATFQREDEFGVFALHAWVWRPNPNGMFAETNPRVSCGTD